MVSRKVLFAAFVAVCARYALASTEHQPPFNTTWLRSRKTMEFSFDAARDVVSWEPQHPDVILTYLQEPLPVSHAGDEVTLRFRINANGTNECPPSDWANGGYCRNDEPCMHQSVNCLAGTGDFRIAFMDSSATGAHHVSDGFAPTTSYSDMSKVLSAEPFSSYVGYNARVFPFVSPKAQRYVPTESGSTAVPCSFNKKVSSQFFDDNRLACFGCFGAPHATWLELDISLKKYDSGNIHLTMSLAGESYTYVDEDHTNMPSQIDTVAIQYPNERHYTYVEFS